MKKKKTKLIEQGYPIFKEVIRKKLKSPNLKYATAKATAVLKKQNGKWILSEQR